MKTAIDLINQYKAGLTEITIDICRFEIKVVIFRFPAETLYIQGNEVPKNFFPVVRILLGEPGRLLLDLVDKPADFTPKESFIADIVPKRKTGWRIKFWGFYVE